MLKKLGIDMTDAVSRTTVGRDGGVLSLPMTP